MTSLRQVRSRARALLAGYLNLEWPTRWGCLLQPWSTRVASRPATEARALLASLALPERAVDRVHDLAEALSVILRTLPAPHAPRSTVTLAIPPAPAGLRVHGEARYSVLRTRLEQLAARTGVRLVLQGSLASDDWTGYRDVDLVMIVPRSRFAAATALEDLRRHCLPALRALHAFDPLQHHGFFVIPEDELAQWPEEWLPLAALERAVDPCGVGFALEVASSHDRAGARAELRWVTARLERLERPRDAYAWKALASLVMLLPALYASACGEPCAKQHSFGRVDRAVSAQAWQPIVWATRLRAGWRDTTPRFVRTLCALAPNPRATALLFRRLAQAPAELLPSDVEGMLAAAAGLARQLEASVDQGTKRIDSGLLAESSKSPVMATAANESV